MLQNMIRIMLSSIRPSRIKMPKFETNVIFRYFWARIWKKYCHIWNHLRFFPDAKFLVKMKILKSRTKNALFGCFEQQFWTTILIAIFEIKFVKNEFLTHAINFGMGPLFLNVLGLPFLKVRVLVLVRFVKYAVSCCFFRYIVLMYEYLRSSDVLLIGKADDHALEISYYVFCFIKWCVLLTREMHV